MDNRRLLLAIALILFVWSGFNLLFPASKNKQEDVKPGIETVSTAEKADVEPAQPSVVSHAAAVNNIERKIAVKSDFYDLVLTTNGARVVDAGLLKYKKTNAENAHFVKVIDAVSVNSGSYGFFGTEGLYLPLDFPYTCSSPNDEIVLSSTEKTDLAFHTRTPEGLNVTKVYTFYPGKYFFDVNVYVENTSSSIIKGTVNLSIVSPWDETQKVDSHTFTGSVSYDGKDLHSDEPKEIKKAIKTYSQNTLWTSFTTKYFANIVKPLEGSLKSINISYKDNTIINTIESPFITLEPKSNYTFKYLGYIGPKDFIHLNQTSLSFEKIIDLGFFGIIGKPLMSALVFFNGFLGNFGFSIVLLTVCIKALFWPLTQKSYSSMKNMQKLQPQMQKLRAKYGKDKQKLNQEMMTLYKENRVNPFGGCLPMLIQIPVFFALYQVLLGAIELRHAPFMLWITDLSAADTLISDALGLGFALGPLPLIMGVTMFVQQRMTPTTMDPMQAKVMMFMPVFFTFLFLSFPSGLVVYWLVNNLLTIAQQYMINRSPA